LPAVDHLGEADSAGPGKDRVSLPLDRGGRGPLHALFGGVPAFRGNSSGTRRKHPALRGRGRGRAPPIPEGLGSIFLPAGYIAALPTPAGKPRGKNPRGCTHIVFCYLYIACCRGSGGESRGKVPGRPGYIDRLGIYIAETGPHLPRASLYMAESQGYMAERLGRRRWAHGARVATRRFGQSLPPPGPGRQRVLQRQLPPTNQQGRMRRQ
jgi:hypothetical protein